MPEPDSADRRTGDRSATALRALVEADECSLGLKLNKSPCRYDFFSGHRGVT